MSTTIPHSSTSQENAAVVRSVYDAYNARDYDRSASLVAEDAEMVIVPFARSFWGPDGMRDFQRGWATAFPDSRTEVRTVTAGEHRVVVEYVGRGRHAGPLGTPVGVIQPTDRTVEVPFCDVFELRGGRIVRARNYFDAATMMEQLGFEGVGPEAAAANVALARRWFDAMNAGDLDAVDILFAPTYRLHYPDLDANAVGPEVIRGLVSAYREAFPDLHFTIDETVASGDTVLVRWTVEGTNRGPLLGGPPTGRFARWTGMSVLRMQRGRIVEDWVENDRLGMLRMLGLAPAPAT